MTTLRGLLATLLALAILPVSPAPQSTAAETALVQAKRHQVRQRPNDGYAVWYGGRFHGRLTASGRRFDANALTAAHRSLPFGTQVRVTNLHNGRSVVVRIDDRLRHRGAAIDVSAAAARQLGLTRSGRVPVRLTVLRRGDA